MVDGIGGIFWSEICQIGDECRSPSFAYACSDDVGLMYACMFENERCVGDEGVEVRWIVPARATLDTEN